MIAPSAYVMESTVAEIVTSALRRSRKTQRQVADEIGYSAPNIITMFKQGLTRVPIPVAPRLAKALDLDPAFFTRACLTEYMPDTLQALEQTFGPLALRQ